MRMALGGFERRATMNARDVAGGMHAWQPHGPSIDTNERNR